jgi:hypothetical protein
VSRFAEDEHIPVVRFTTTDRKIEVMRPYLAAQAATGRSGVAAIGVAQEYAKVFSGTQRDAPNGIPWFSFAKADRRVSCYYFYRHCCGDGQGAERPCRRGGFRWRARVR